MDLRMLLLELLQTLLEDLIAVPIFQDGERRCGRLTIGSKERDAMAIACGIDPDADAERSGRGYGESPLKRKVDARLRSRRASGKER
jgi:hypothetical protein